MNTDQMKTFVKHLDKMIKTEKFDQQQLLEIADEFGVEHPQNTNCGDCWKDFAIVLRSHIKEQMMPPERKYVLKDGVDVYFHGERINNGMLTDKKAEELVEEGFATYLFAKMPEE